MASITREIIDRRQPTIRWSAVIAGATLGLGVWSVLQVLGLGASLAGIDPAHAESSYGVVIGGGAWPVLAPLIAALSGGYLAAKLASTPERKIAIEHGLLVWGLTTAIGLILAFGFASLAQGRERAPLPTADPHPSEAVFRDAWVALAPVNYGLQLTGRPEITPEALVDAARAASDGDFDRDRFAAELAGRSGLPPDDARSAADRLAPTARRLADRTAELSPAERRTLVTAVHAGEGMIALALASLLSLGTAILGALLAVRRLRGPRRWGEAYVTAPYPLVPTTPPANDTTD